MRLIYRRQNLGDENIEACMLVVPSEFVDVVICSKCFAIILYVIKEGIIL